MSEDLVIPAPAPIVIHPATGEVVPLDGPTDMLASFLASTRELEGALREAKRAVSAELHARMDAEASWTLHVRSYTITGESPNRIEYDADKLHARLAELVADDLLAPRAAEQAVEVVTTRKARARGINQLLKLGGAVADAIKTCQVPVERDRRISVKARRDT
jgi:hypothetical protein